VTIAIGVEPDRKAKALNFPMEHVLSRYAKDYPALADSARLHEQELKKYLYICSQNPDRGWPMVNSIDDLWHTFLIFTPDYHQFCRGVGVPYLHHQPLNDGEDTSGIPQAYQDFLRLYRRDFGEPPRSVWPQTLELKDCGSGCSNGGCSGIGCGSQCGSSCR
jgi:hypothetical protein